MERSVAERKKTMRVVLGFSIIALGVIFRSPWGMVGIIPVFHAIVKYNA